MLRRFATLLVVLLVTGSSAFAEAKVGGTARNLAMGGSQASSGVILNPFLLQDPSLLLVNPAYQTMYKDYVWMNLGGGTLNNVSTGDNGYGKQFSGINLAVSKEFSLGAILSYDPSAVNVIGNLLKGVTVQGVTLPAFVQNRQAQTIPQISNVFEVLGSYDAGALDFGFGAMTGWASTTSKTSATGGASSETEASASMFGFRAGLIYDLGGGSSVDMSAGIRLDKAKDISKTSTGSLGEYSASGTEIQFAVRAGLKASNRVTFIPYGVVAIVSGEPKEDSPPAGVQPQRLSEKLSAMAFGLGVGAEYRLPKFLLASGVSFQSVRLKLEATPSGQPTATSTYSYTAIPVFNVGAEWWWTDWLAGRGGYFRSIGKLSTKNETTAGTSETGQTLNFSNVIVGGIAPGSWDGIVTIGVGMKVGNFAVDATISDEAIRRGLGLIGTNDNLNTFGYMTLSYNFE